MMAGMAEDAYSLTEFTVDVDAVASFRFVCNDVDTDG